MYIITITCIVGLLFHYLDCKSISKVFFNVTATTPAPGSTSEYVIFDPVFGRLTPSQDIKDFVASVFRQNDEEEDYDVTTMAGPEETTPEGENKTHYGFEQYWHGGDWVYRAAEYERCNFSETACKKVLGSYGKICAGNHDLTVHTTFDTLCDMYEMNCWDGGYNTFTTEANTSVLWFPVAPSGYIDFGLATATTNCGFILARTRSLHARPRLYMEYATNTSRYYRGNYSIRFNGKKSISYGASFQIFYNPFSQLDWEWQTLANKKLLRNRLSWNETKGMVELRHMDNNPDWPDSFLRYNYSDLFAIHYFGIWGGTKKWPAYWELSNLPRGYMPAYRGKCRPDLPTLPTEQPVTLRHDIDIENYNLAERLDELGYNKSRINFTLNATNKQYYYPDEELSDIYD